jgi:SLT domain-containing protein
MNREEIPYVLAKSGIHVFQNSLGNVGESLRNLKRMICGGLSKEREGKGLLIRQAENINEEHFFMRLQSRRAFL